MNIIYRDIYREKCGIFINFRFLCLNFDSHFKGQNFKTHFFLLRVHRSYSNIAIFRKFGPKRARHKEDQVWYLIV